jgi:hypothetical protein
MAINFPNNPIDGNTYEYNKVQYQFVDLGGSSGFWKTITTATGPCTSQEIDDGAITSKYVTPANLEDSKYNDALNYLVPSGLISMWHGANNTIPTGWSLCDGANGTPDLRDRFIVGAGTRWAVGDTGGSHNAVVVSHNHSASSGSAGTHNHSGNTSSNGNHNHTGNTSYEGNHSHSGDTGSDVGAHSHTYKDWKYGGSGPTHDSNNNWTYGDVNRTTESAGGHGHSLSINWNGNHRHSFSTSDSGNHYHNFTTSTVGNHSHSVSVGNTGESGTDKNIPLFYALAYIMKT